MASSRSIIGSNGLPRFTLLRRGELRAPNDDPELQSELNQYIPYQYIIQWFKKHEGRTGLANRFLVIQSGTASGKSTTIPSEIYLNLVHHRFTTGGGIICTQPRILTTKDNVKQIVGISKFAPVLKIGETIGWSTQFSKVKPRRLGLLSAVIEILTMQLQVMSDAEIMSLYRFILIDEAHERSMDADITFAALKGFLQRNSNTTQCPFVVLMSATIDPPKFARYFLGPQENGEPRTIDQMLDNIIICNALPSFKREKNWPERPIDNIIEHAAGIVGHILDSSPAARETWDPLAVTHLPPDKLPREADDILIFLPGIADMTSMREALQAMNAERAEHDKTQVAIVMLNRETIMDDLLEYRQLDMPIRDIPAVTRPERRVIISTSVAETGKTFDTLRYVIDAGYSRENEYNPNIKVEILLSKPAQKSRIEQRVGRVGRKFPGVVYPLYTEELYSRLQGSQYPEILTSNITSHILKIVFEQQKVKTLYYNEHKDQRNEPYFRVSDIDMLDTPPPDILMDALEHAYALGFIAHGPTKFSVDPTEFFETTEHVDSKYVGITKLGRIALELSAVLDSLESIRMVLAGFAWKYRPADLIAIAIFTKLKAQEDPDKSESKGRAQMHINLAYQELFGATAAAIAPAGSQVDIMSAWHTVLGDTFFDGLVISAAIDKVFATANETNMFAGIQQWCGYLGINFESLLHFIQAKDAACNALLTLGFDPYVGASIITMQGQSGRPDPNRLADVILRYKHCIFDGYRLNSIHWNESRRQYETFTGLHVNAQMLDRNFLIDRNEHIQSFIVDKYVCKANKKTSTYDVIGNQISILDGFIGEDPYFTQ